MTSPRVVSRQEWLTAREAFAEKEKSFAKARNDLTEERRHLPWLRIDNDFVFDGPHGSVGLQDLFEGRRQLLVYHFWFPHGESPCDGCTLWTNDLGELGGEFASLHEHDASLAFVSRATPDEITSVKSQRNWTMPWYSLVGEQFEDVTGYNGWAQISIFVREDDAAYLANVVSFEDLTTIGNHWTLLERCPFGTKNS